ELPLSRPVFDHEVAALHVTEVAQSLEESVSRVGRSGRIVVVPPQVAYSSDLCPLLGLGGDRRKNDADSENGREPDQPQGHLGGGWRAGSLADRRDTHQRGAAAPAPSCFSVVERSLGPDRETSHASRTRDNSRHHG